MRRSLLRLPAVVAAFAVVVFAAAGCGSGEAFTSRDVGKAIDTTRAAGTAKIELAVQLDGVEGAPAAAADGIVSKGAIDFDSGNGSLALDAKAAGLPGGEIELRFVDETIFVQLPALFAGATGGGGQWIAITPEAIEKASGTAANLAQFGSFDPSNQLELLRSVAEPLRSDGGADVRGQKATKYVGDVDLAKVIDTRSAIKSNIGGNEATREKLAGIKIPVAVFVDDENRIVRYTAQIDLGAVSRASGGTTSGKAAIEVDFFDFGTAVDVAPPPADQVTDGASLLNALGN
jgi:hypothetical protein